MGFKSAGAGSSGYQSAGGSSTHHGLFHRIIAGIGGLGEHFASDVKDAVTGIPTGTVMLVKHPETSVKAIGKAMWQDWAPLLEGHPGKFLHQTYDHPLAPLLDIATVFSAGAGLAGKSAAALEAAGASGRTVEALANLTKASTRVVHDTQGMARAEEAAAAGAENTKGLVGAPLKKVYRANTTAAARRALANRALLHLEPHLPAWFKQSAREGRLYNRLQVTNDAHKLFAQHVQTHALFKAAQIMGDTESQRIIQPAVLMHSYTNLRRFANTVKDTHVLTKDEVYVKSHAAAAPFLKFNERMPDLAARLDRFGREFTTTKLSDAARGEGGVRVVRKDVAKAYGKEGADSARFLKQLPNKATTWWKRINVGYTPRTVTNNTVGNWFMYAMRTSGHGGARAIVDAIRYSRGQRAAMRAFKDMHAHILDTQGREAAAKFLAAAHPDIVDQPNLASISKVFGAKAAEAVTRRPNWIDRFFKNEIGNTFGNALDMAQAEAEGGVAGRLKGVAKSGFYPLVHRIADQPVRVAALYAFLRKSPEVRAFLKSHPGVSLDDAISQVLEKNPNELMARATDYVRSIAGDYVTRGPVERAVQSIIPFYLWDKHILSHVGAMASENPGRLALAQNVSRMGNEENQQLLGELPSFMQNTLPLELLGLADHNNRTPLLMTQGLNPYASVGDIAETLGAFGPGMGKQTGADAASNLSPLLAGLVEQISGRKIGSEAPVATHGGIIPSLAVDTAQSLGYASLIQRLLGGGTHGVNSKGEPTLYAGSPSEAGSSLFGLPIREASTTAIAQQVAKQHPKKKKRKGAFVSAGG